MKAILCVPDSGIQTIKIRRNRLMEDVAEKLGTHDFNDTLLFGDYVLIVDRKRNDGDVTLETIKGRFLVMKMNKRMEWTGLTEQDIREVVPHLLAEWRNVG